MTVYLEKQNFPYLNASMLHLRWSWLGRCRASETPTHLVLSTSLDDCGTTVTEMGDLIIFTNEIEGDIQVQNYITRDHDFDLQFNCSYSRKKLLGLSFITGEIFVQDPGIGTLNEHIYVVIYKPGTRVNSLTSIRKLLINKY